MKTTLCSALSPSQGAFGLFRWGGLLLLAFAVLPHLAKAQFQLPTHTVLKEHSIKTIEVREKLLGIVPRDTSLAMIPSKLDTTVLFRAVYFLNTLGCVDSIIRFPFSNGYAQKEVFFYDVHGNIKKYKVLNANKEEVVSQELSKVSSHWVYKRWEYGKLLEVKKYTQDSILVVQEIYRSADSIPTFWMTFDLEQDIKTTYQKVLYNGYRLETYQWTSMDGVPGTFTNTLKELEDGGGKPIYKEKTYPLDSLGQVVNKYTGRFDDPYLDANFFERHQRLKPIYFSDRSLFVKDQLTIFQEVNIPYLFDGTQKRIRFDFTYK